MARNDIDDHGEFELVWSERQPCEAFFPQIVTAHFYTQRSAHRAACSVMFCNFEVISWILGFLRGITGHSLILFLCRFKILDKNLLVNKILWTRAAFRGNLSVLYQTLRPVAHQIARDECCDDGECIGLLSCAPSWLSRRSPLDFHAVWDVSTLTGDLSILLTGAFRFFVGQIKEKDLIFPPPYATPPRCLADPLSIEKVRNFYWLTILCFHSSTQSAHTNSVVFITTSPEFTVLQGGCPKARSIHSS